MYRAVIFYFSATGNTWWVADKIKKQMDAKNINADIVSIDSIDAKKANWWIKTADLVLFGWPISRFDMPEPVKTFIDGLFVVEKGKHIHVFCTQRRFSGNGAWMAHRAFKQKGLTIDTAAHFLMPFIRGNVQSPRSQRKISEAMDRCGEQVACYVDGLLIGTLKITGRYAFLPALIRVVFKTLTKMSPRKVGLDQSRCSQCGLCETICPAGNIRLSPYPEFGDHCAHCLRCYAFCPEGAITVNGHRRRIKKKGLPYTVQDKRFKPSLLK